MGLKSKEVFLVSVRAQIGLTSRMQLNVINGTINTAHIKNMPERYKEALVKKSEIKRKENENIMKKMN